MSLFSPLRFSHATSDQLFAKTPFHFLASPLIPGKTSMKTLAKKKQEQELKSQTSTLKIVKNFCAPDFIDLYQRDFDPCLAKYPFFFDAFLIPGEENSEGAFQKLQILDSSHTIKEGEFGIELQNILKEYHCYPVNSVIVCQFSKLLSMIFSHTEMLEAKYGIVPVFFDDPEQVLPIVLSFCYNHEITLDDNNALGVLAFSERLMMSEVQEFSKNFILGHLSQGNILNFLIHSKFYMETQPAPFGEEESNENQQTEEPNNEHEEENNEKQQTEEPNNEHFPEFDEDALEKNEYLIKTNDFSPEKSSSNVQIAQSSPDFSPNLQNTEKFSPNPQNSENNSLPQFASCCPELMQSLIKFCCENLTEIFKNELTKPQFTYLSFETFSHLMIQSNILNIRRNCAIASEIILYYLFSHDKNNQNDQISELTTSQEATLLSCLQDISPEDAFPVLKRAISLQKELEKEGIDVLFEKSEEISAISGSPAPKPKPDDQFSLVNHILDLIARKFSDILEIQSQNAKDTEKLEKDESPFNFLDENQFLYLMQSENLMVSDEMHVYSTIIDYISKNYTKNDDSELEFQEKLLKLVKLEYLSKKDLEIVKKDGLFPPEVILEVLFRSHLDLSNCRASYIHNFYIPKTYSELSEMNEVFFSENKPISGSSRTIDTGTQLSLNPSIKFFMKIGNLPSNSPNSENSKASESLDFKKIKITKETLEYLAKNRLFDDAFLPNSSFSRPLNSSAGSPLNSNYEQNKFQCILTDYFKFEDEFTIFGISLKICEIPRKKIENFRIGFANLPEDNTNPHFNAQKFVKLDPEDGIQTCYGPKSIINSVLEKDKWFTFILDTPFKKKPYHIAVCEFSSDGSSNSSSNSGFSYSMGFSSGISTQSAGCIYGYPSSSNAEEEKGNLRSICWYSDDKKNCYPFSGASPDNCSNWCPFLRFVTSQERARSYRPMGYIKTGNFMPFINDSKLYLPGI